MRQSVIVLILFLVLSNTAEAQTCKDLPVKFYSYNEAIRFIQNATFKTTDELPYGKSSWIKNAKFYSCDGYYGYLIVTTGNGKEYIHEKVPLRVWTEFKNASSSGSYYDKNIKHHYRLVPD